MSPGQAAGHRVVTGQTPGDNPASGSGGGGGGDTVYVSALLRHLYSDPGTQLS